MLFFLLSPQLHNPNHLRTNLFTTYLFIYLFCGRFCLPWDVTFFLELYYLINLFIYLFGRNPRHLELPGPGIKPECPAVEAWSLNHWTTKEVLRTNLLTPYFIL